MVAQEFLNMCVHSARAGAHSNITDDLEHTQQKWVLLAASAQGKQADGGRPQEAERLRDEVHHAFSGLVGAEHELGARWCHPYGATCISFGQRKHAAQRILHMWIAPGEKVSHEVSTFNRYGVQLGTKVPLWGGFSGDSVLVD